MKRTKAEVSLRGSLLGILIVVSVTGACSQAMAPYADGSIQTGEIDEHNYPDHPACAITPVSWRITLSLIAPSESDAVGVVGMSPVPNPGNTAGGAVASSLQPTVQFKVHAPSDCPPYIVIVGLHVEGSLNYYLEWVKVP